MKASWVKISVASFMAAAIVSVGAIAPSAKAASHTTSLDSSSKYGNAGAAPQQAQQYYRDWQYINIWDFLQNGGFQLPTPTEPAQPTIPQPTPEPVAPQPVAPQPVDSGSKETGTEETQGSSEYSAFQTEVTRLVNIERSKAGLSALSVDALLTKVATEKARDLDVNNYFSHTSPTYGSPFDMMTQFGVTYSYAGENIAAGQRSPQEVVTAWMNSEGHRANILSNNFKKIGVGFVNNKWVQMFIG